MGGRTPKHNKYYALINTLKLKHPVFITSNEKRISHTMRVASHINRSITFSWPVANKFLERCKPNTIHLKRLEDSCSRCIQKIQQQDQFLPVSYENFIFWKWLKVAILKCTLQRDTLQRQQQIVNDYSKNSHWVVNSSTTRNYLKFLNLI
jgi:hypothetical protein